MTLRNISTVHYNGVYWKDIDWNLPVHEMKNCDECGADGAEGHQNACQYLYKNQESPAGATFIRRKIYEALMRQGSMP